MFLTQYRVATGLFSRGIPAHIIGAIIMGALLVGGGLAVAQTPETPPVAGATPFGAAHYLPDDVAIYSSAFDVIPRMKRIHNSNAVQQLLHLPLLAEATASVNLDPVRKTLADNDLPNLLPMLEDGMSHEFFMCVGGQLVPFTEAVSSIMNEVWRLQLSLGQESRTDDAIAIGLLIKTALSHGKDLHLPPMLVGLRVEDTAVAGNALAELMAKIPPSPEMTLSKRIINGQSFHVLQASLANEKENIAAGLVEAGVATDDAKAFAAFLATRPVRVCMGIQDGYVLVSIAEDDGLLQQWGREKASRFAACESLAPLRKNYKPGLMSMQYRSAVICRLMGYRKENLDETIRAIETASPDLIRPDIRKQIATDLRELAGKVPEDDLRDHLGFSFDNQGVESWTYPSDALGTQQKVLDILAHRGAQPVAVYATATTNNARVYDILAMIIRKSNWYIDNALMPEMEGDDRSELLKALGVIRPFLSRIDQAVTQHLLPATADVQSFNVLDWNGILPLPVMNPDEPLPLPIPRLAGGMELTNAEQFRTGVSACREALVAMIDSAKKTWPRQIPQEITLHEAVSEPLAGGTLYYYHVPVPLGPDVLPCAWMNDRVLLVSTSRRHLEEMIQKRALPEGDPLISLNAPAESVMYMDFTQLWNAFDRTLKMAAPLAGEDPDVQMVLRHVEGALQSLRAIRSMQSRTYEENGRRVVHSRLRVEDITP